MNQRDVETFALEGPENPAALERGSVFFVGTATTIIRCGGFTLLTDPNFLHAGDHAHLGYGLTSRRRTNPALEVEDLPSLDACILSHRHGDHWDRVAEARLPRTLPVITTPQAARKLQHRGFHMARGLETWQSVRFARGGVWMRITALPGRHAPGPIHSLLPAVMGSLIEWGRDAAPVFQLYITGDTLIYDRIEEIPRRFPEIDLAMLHLGGTRILGLLVTMDAEQGIRMLRIIQPRKAIPIHYDDYPVFKSSLEDFRQAVREAGLEEQVHILRRGETYEFTVPGIGTAAGS